MRVFFSAGEASGDAYAAALLREMVRLGPGLRFLFEGIGGSQLAAAGANVVVDSSKWGAISILQSLKVAPRVVGGYSKAKRALRKGRPGLFIPIDFGYVNVRLARYAKKHGWKVLYFIPPGSWRRHKQGKDLPAVADEIVTPFPWSAEILRKMGAKVHFFGHPLKQMIANHPRYEGERASVAVLPGSRMHEIKENLPVVAQAVSAGPGHRGGAVGKANDFPYTIEFAVASSVDAEDLRRRWLALAPERTGDTFSKADTYGVLSRARAAIVCSGTATLEAALCRCPMIVMYRFGKLTEMEIRFRRVRPKFISLPNILLDRPIVPELIQQEAIPKRIRSLLEGLLPDGASREDQLRAFEELDAVLGPPEAITKTAELGLKMMN
jgi:lipid-A-disaccharide synthase